MNRRNLMNNTLLGLGALLSSKVEASAQCLGTTPQQTEGPFYPIRDQRDKDWDLTSVRGRSDKAKGQIAFVTGVVSDEECKPVKGALVEIWQACASGKYNHPNDPNNAELDPDFQYWGRYITDQYGRYMFKTIVPGVYPASQDWFRPPHIHFKVHLRGYQELTTQMYFKGHKYNQYDRILRSLSRQDQRKVVVSFFKTKGVYYPKGSIAGRFDISLQRVL